MRRFELHATRLKVEEGKGFGDLRVEQNSKETRVTREQNKSGDSANWGRMDLTTFTVVDWKLANIGDGEISITGRGEEAYQSEEHCRKAAGGGTAMQVPIPEITSFSGGANRGWFLPGGAIEGGRVRVTPLVK